jgi:glycosyltransferase involved in cell wall biosynthesis
MRCAVVVPCYNEERRLDRREIAALVAAPGVDALLVDDGSRDGTLALLRELELAHPGRVFVLGLAKNGGKAEAVRSGLRAALERGYAVAGYLDADMATPAIEMLRLLAALEAEPRFSVVLGARVRLLGHDIRRTGPRHYLGRLFATIASMVLELPVYDTQCGAKAFRAGPALEAALARPFSSRWAFDVELLLRLTRGPAALRSEELLEVPLKRWADLGGSKLTATAMLRAGLDLLALGLSRDD